MGTTMIDISPTGRLRVRPIVLIGCASLLAVVFLPHIFRQMRSAELSLLVLASASAILGWFFLPKYKETNNKWRAWIAILTSMYLTISLPAFFFELSPAKWFLHSHRWPSLYVRPWVHWGPIPVYLSVIGAFYACGKFRIAFVVCSVSLVILWEALGWWTF